MEPEDYIIEQLKDQEIEFELVQSGYEPADSSAVSKTVKKWSSKFIGKRTAPQIENYLWHIFSFEATKSQQGKNALDELKKQYVSETLIFNEPQQYLIRCWGKIPMIEMENFFDDIYMCHHNMNWTYVIPHEAPEMGPYFSIG
jgi:hypothetical protein